MTTVEAPISHLRENPFELAQEQLRKVADAFKIDPNLVRVLERCKKAVVVSIPFSRDDGTIEVFEGYRVTHNIARGPSKGGNGHGFRPVAGRGPGGVRLTSIPYWRAPLASTRVAPRPMRRP